MFVLWSYQTTKQTTHATKTNTLHYRGEVISKQVLLIIITKWLNLHGET